MMCGSFCGKTVICFIEGLQEQLRQILQFFINTVSPFWYIKFNKKLHQPCLIRRFGTYNLQINNISYA